MLKLKKIWLFLLGIMVVFGLSLQYTEWWLSIPRDHRTSSWSVWKDRDSDWKIDGEKISTVDPMWHWRKVVDDMDEWIITLDQPSDYDTWLWYALTLVQIAVNRTLGMLAFVTLVYMVYNWFLVLSAWSNDKNVDKGKKWIKNAIIAIVWIALAWLVISAIIRLIWSFS
jgi:hypothetical protein